MKKKIALLTAGHLTSCPRLLKELKLFIDNGFDVSVIYLDYMPDLSSLDKEVIKKYTTSSCAFYPVKWHKYDFKSICSFAIYKIVNFLNPDSDYLQSTTYLFIKRAKSIKADLYIAHHPSVLVAAALAAKKYKSKYSYDIEDAFPYIMDGSTIDNYNKQIFEIENKYLKRVEFLTTASPLYSELYINNYKLSKTPIELLNVFDINYKEIPYRDRVDLNKISFYWYSQTVGLNRGLQDIFYVINKLPIDSFELHIRGKCDAKVKSELLKIITNKSHVSSIFFHELVSVFELDDRNKEHDIGLALEIGNSLNRELCITNKILDYIRSGLMIIATNTSGHKVITDQLSDNIIIYNSSEVDILYDKLIEYIINKESIYNAKRQTLDLAKRKYNWTLQSLNFLNEINYLF